MKSRDNEAARVLLRVLPETLQPEYDGDLVRLSYEGRSWSLLPIWVGEGLPADARRGAAEAAQSANILPEVVPVIVAKRISPGARAHLAQLELSWADASGRADIAGPGPFFISRLEPVRAEAGRRFKWSAAADAIAEVLLAWRVDQAGPIDRVYEIAEAADLSTAHTARVLRQFDEQRYTKKTGAERGSSATREITDPGRLLSDWAGHHAREVWPTPLGEFHVPWRSAEQTLPVVTTAFAGLSWAITGEMAADRIAPFLTSVSTLSVYAPADEWSKMRAHLSGAPEVTEVESGGRIRVYAADRYVMRLVKEVRGVPVVSPVRVYADMLRQGGRHAEAAEHLREVALGF